MLVGHAITCLQLRQMEFDADYYGASVAGSRSFAETMAEIGLLHAAGQGAFDELGQLWHNRQLVDDFPAFVALRRDQLDPRFEVGIHLDDPDLLYLRGRHAQSPRTAAEPGAAGGDSSQRRGLGGHCGRDRARL